MMQYPVDRDTLKEQVRRVLPEIKKLRQELRRIPEIGFKEFKTAERIRRVAKSTSVEVIPPLLETDESSVEWSPRHAAAPCMEICNSEQINNTRN